MDYSKVLVTGGSGLLGSELKKLIPEAYFPSHKVFNLTDFEGMYNYFMPNVTKIILHCAALTSPPVIEKDIIKAIKTNIIGTSNLVMLCSVFGVKLIYISTDYVYDGKCSNSRETEPVFPCNKYAWSKLGGECAVMLYDNSLIIRTSFGEKKFPHERAFIDQFTSRETVDVIAKKIVSILDKNLTGILNIGGERKSVYDYAKALKPDVKPMRRCDVDFNVPCDTSLDCSKYDELFVIKKQHDVEIEEKQ